MPAARARKHLINIEMSTPLRCLTGFRTFLTRRGENVTETDIQKLWTQPKHITVLLEFILKYMTFYEMIQLAFILKCDMSVFLSG